MGSDESHFNVSLIVRNKVTRPFPQTTTFLKRKESRSGSRTEVLPLTSLTPLPLGQTGSQLRDKRGPFSADLDIQGARAIRHVICQERAARDGEVTLTCTGFPPHGSMGVVISVPPHGEKFGLCGTRHAHTDKDSVTDLTRWVQRSVFTGVSRSNFN